MPKHFFELADDVYVPDRWHLATPTDSHGEEVHDSDFWNGTPVHLQDRLRVPVEIAGKALAYTEAGIHIPVVHDRVASIFAEFAANDVQLLPVDVEGQPDPYFILVATRRIRCIDEKASRFDRWTHEAGLPEMVGRYFAVYELRIDKAKVGSAQVFRCEDWHSPLIISEDIKSALEAMGATGTRFTEV